MFVDPLAEDFVGWTPYHYVHNNPINLIDPKGMSAEGLDHDPPKENAKGEKVLHIKYHGKDVSIYENDDNILARGYRAFKEIRKKVMNFYLVVFILMMMIINLKEFKIQENSLN